MEHSENPYYMNVIYPEVEEKWQKTYEDSQAHDDHDCHASPEDGCTVCGLNEYHED